MGLFTAQIELQIQRMQLEPARFQLRQKRLDMVEPHQFNARKPLTP